LESEGLLHISPRRGVVVRELSNKEIADLYEIRLAVESYALSAVAGKLTVPQAAELKRNLFQQASAVRRRDIRDLIRTDTEFHLLCCGFLGNLQITETLARLRDQMHRVIARVAALHPQRMIASAEEHRLIGESLLSGPSSQVAAHIAFHLRQGRNLLVLPQAD